MRKVLFVCAALICFSLTAAAQDSTAGRETITSESDPPTPVTFVPPGREAWQLGIGFEYSHYDVLGTSFHDFGYQANITRYFNNWFGLEGTAMVGFGHAGSNPTLDAKSFFIGGGPHIALYNSSNFEPWFHVLPGWERFRFTQTAVLGDNSNLAFMAGGGVDYKIRGGRIYWRVQGDYIGTRIGSSISNDYAFGTGVILNF